MSKPLTPEAWVDWVSVRHPGDQRLEVTLHFPLGPPAEGMSYGADIATTTDLDGAAAAHDPVLVVNSPDRFHSTWYADGDGLDRPPQQVPPSVNVNASRHTVDIVVDLDGQNKLLGNGPFKPEIQMSSAPIMVASNGTLPMVFQPQACTWNTPISSTPPSGASTPAATAPEQQLPAPAAPAASVTVPGADGHGFLGNYLARCLDVDPAVAIGRTNSALVVVCQSRNGALYYKGMGLQNQQGVYADGVTRTSSGFTVTNNGVLYTISSSELTITQGGSVLSDEPMTAYWSQ
ncbi:hypothetical protein [Mycolicibacterium sp. HS_4_1]